MAVQWALARMARSDLLLTDWNMPGINGSELCRIFRADPVLASVPITLTSAMNSPPAGVSLLHNLFLHKPADAGALLAAVSALAIATGAAEAAEEDAKPDEEKPGN
jgi:CheY-like chemotaxis protein